MKTTKTSKSLGLAGFTLVEIMIVVAIIGMLAAIAIPNFIKARTTSQQNACINNLRQIDGAKQQWALETHQVASASATSTAIQPYLGRGANGSLTTVVCPADSSAAPTIKTSYAIGTLNVAPQCNIGGPSGTSPTLLHVLN